MSVCKNFLHRWYYIIIGTVQVIACSLCRPSGQAVVCLESWARQSCMLTSSTGQRACRGEMAGISLEKGMAVQEGERRREVRE